MMTPSNLSLIVLSYIIRILFVYLDFGVIPVYSYSSIFPSLQTNTIASQMKSFYYSFFFAYSSSIYLATVSYNSNGQINISPGNTLSSFIPARQADTVMMEVDLRSTEPEHRLLRWWVGGQLQNIVITHLPSAINFYISLPERDVSIRFVSLTEYAHPLFPYNPTIPRIHFPSIMSAGTLPLHSSTC